MTRNDDDDDIVWRLWLRVRFCGASVRDGDHRRSGVFYTAQRTIYENETIVGRAACPSRTKRKKPIYVFMVLYRRLGSRLSIPFRRLTLPRTFYPKT